MSMIRLFIKYTLPILMFMLLCQSISAQHLAISGYIIDNESKETLIGAVVTIDERGISTASDSYGFFQLVGMKPGEYKLLFSYVGFEPRVLTVMLTDKSILLPDVEMKARVTELGEVAVLGAKPDAPADREVETSIIELSAKSIQSIPTAGNDVFSAIKYLPGIDRTEPFSPLFTVRGGEPGENAVLLDGVMIYNPYHASVSSGIFNTQIIKSVDILVGGFGAEYGGRNSSVMYITTKDGNSSELHGEIEPSTFHSKLFLEFPAGKNGSAIVAARYFYDIFSEFIFQSRSYFYDFNLSYTCRLNAKNRLTLKYFRSHDRSNVDLNSFYKYLGNTIGWDIYDDFNFRLTNRWTNNAVTLIHKWVVSPRVYVRSQAYYSAHSSDNYSGMDFQFPAVMVYDTSEALNDTLNFRLFTSSDFKNRISDLSAKTQINFVLSRYSELTTGVDFNRYSFENNAHINEVDQGSLTYEPMQWAIFAEDKLETGPFILRPGIRCTQYDNDLWHFEPRVNAVLGLPAKFRLRAAWGIYYQYVISMNTNEVEMNQAVDYYFPLTSYQPSKSIHYIAGIDKQLNNQSVLSLDVYYKDIERIYTFDINQTDVDVLTLSDKLQMGSGDAYGAELMLRGAYKNISGWCSYGLAWAHRTYPFLNGGREYPYDYNRRHTVKLVANYVITKTLEYNASFTYLSGNYRSIEQIRQDYYYYDPESGEMSRFPIWISNEKNNAKMPSIINLDMSIRKRLRSGFGKQLSDVFNAKESYLTVTIRNFTFFRRNVDYFFPMEVPRWEGKYLPIGTNYFPTVGLSYTIKF
jgi:hypothetical protein